MVVLSDLTVGQVSGIIAAAVFIVQFLIPVALPIILLGLLRPRSAAVTETAVSWSVIGRFLHNSLWPTLLRTDSAATWSACKWMQFMSFFKTFMLILVAIAAIVTPLGLYEGIVPAASSDSTAFHYIRDTTPMGYGTPPRTNTTWSRICGAFAIIPCPNDNNVATVVQNSSMITTNFEKDWYDTSVPQKVIDVLQSGASELGGTVSSSFDIQYRSYVKSVVDDMKKKTSGPIIDNGTARTVGMYQPLSSLVLNDEIVPVEGLVVDMKNGGIAFRNHSAPTWHQYGSTWSENLLFVVPDTVCVNTNLTLDFEIARTQTELLMLSSAGIMRPVLVDHGGFVNINKTYPASDLGDEQVNPRLWFRAYKGAWLSNAFAMAYMNVTSTSNETTGQKSFAYLNSTMGKQFPLYFPDGKTAISSLYIKPNSLSIATQWGDFLSGTEGTSNVSTLGNETKIYNFTAQAPLYSNPFHITSSNWSTIDIVCRGQGGGDFANITHIAATCGFLYGAPRRKDDSNSSLFDPGSSWTLPMYSCASAAKALIRTVSFRFNGTDDDLSGLKVVSIADKVYSNEESKPLWAVENTDMFLKDGSSMWGIVSEDNARKLNLSTVRRESMYLPGGTPGISSQNLPGAHFAAIALSMAYDTGSSMSMGSTGATIDYTGRSNLAMYKKWQELSKTPETSAKILNLIWTDIAANMVVGTKGLQSHDGVKSKRDAAASNSQTPAVVNYTRRVQYKYAYSIPAFLALALFATAALATLFFSLFSGASPSTMRTFLQHTSAGRFLTSQGGQAPRTSYGGHTPTSHDDGYSNAPTSVWKEGVGKQKFTLGAEGWTKNVQHVPGYEGKSGASVSYAPVPNPQGHLGLYERQEM